MIEIIDIVARGGGGGSGGGGGGGGIIAIPIVIGGIILTWWYRKKRIARAKANQQAALATDQTWSDEVIINRASTVFHTLQQDWSNYDIKSMSHYMTARYHEHMVLMMAALKQMNRRNRMEKVELKSVTLFGVDDRIDNELDTFNVEISARASDYLVDEASGDTIHSVIGSFTEVWHFDREKGDWMLDNITQLNHDGLVTKFDPVTDTKYHEFAEENGFFYNADFGWLLMPLNGLLFSESIFGNSDINHHVIGSYHDRVIQFFEYTPLIQDKAKFKDHFKHFFIPKRNSLATYTIAQVTLPKTYGNIIVERRKTLGLFDFTPGGMTKMNLEWPQFNKLFNVYATDMERVASLELLHPAFMEKLGDLSFRFNIEIIDNNLYLYTTDRNADYAVMLALLCEAFEEMKL